MNAFINILLSTFNTRRRKWKYRYVKFARTIVVVIVSLFELQLPMQSVPINTKVVSSNPVHSEVYSIQQSLIKFVNYLRQVGGFRRVLWFPPLIKLTATI